MPTRHRVNFHPKCPKDHHAKLRDPRCRDDVDEKHKKHKFPYNPYNPYVPGINPDPDPDPDPGPTPVDPDFPIIPINPIPGRYMWSFDPEAAGIGGGVGAGLGFLGNRWNAGAFAPRARINPMNEEPDSSLRAPIDEQAPADDGMPTLQGEEQPSTAPWEQPEDDLDMMDLPEPIDPVVSSIARAIGTRINGQSFLAEGENAATRGGLRSVDIDEILGIDRNASAEGGEGFAARMGLRQSRIAKVEEGGDGFAERMGLRQSRILKVQGEDNSMRVDGQSELAEGENAATRGGMRTFNMDEQIGQDVNPAMDATPEVSFVGDGSGEASGFLNSLNMAKRIKQMFQPTAKISPVETADTAAETSAQSAETSAQTALDNAEQSQGDLSAEVSTNTSTVATDTTAASTDTAALTAAETPVAETVPDLISFDAGASATEGASALTGVAEGTLGADGTGALTAAQLSSANATSAAVDAGEGELAGGGIQAATSAVSGAAQGVGELAAAEGAVAPLDFATLGMSAVVAAVGVGISQFVSWLVGDVEHNQATYAATQPMTDGDIANIQTNLNSVVSQAGLTQAEATGTLGSYTAQQEMDNLQNTSAEGTWVNTGAGFNVNQETAMGEELAFKAAGSNSVSGMWAGFNQVEGSGGEWGNDQSINFGLASGSNGTTAQQQAGMAAWKKAVKYAPATATAATNLIAKVKQAKAAGLPVWNVNLGANKGSQIVIQLSQAQLAQAAAQAVANPSAFKGMNPNVLNAMGLNGSVLSRGENVQSTGVWKMDGSNDGQGEWVSTPAGQITVSNKYMYSPWLMKNPTDIPTPAMIQTAISNQTQLAQNNYILQAQSQIAGQTGSVANYLTYELNLWKYNQGLTTTKPAVVAEPTGSANATAIQTALTTLSSAQQSLETATSTLNTDQAALTAAQALTTTSQATLTADQATLASAQQALTTNQTQYNATLSGSLQQSYDEQYAALTNAAREGNFVPDYNNLINPKQLYLSAGGKGTAPTNILTNANSATTGISFHNGSPVISQALQNTINPPKPSPGATTNAPVAANQSTDGSGKSAGQSSSNVATDSGGNTQSSP